MLEDLGQCTRMGEVGAGQTTKMVNELLLVLNNYCILAEALALAEAGGVDAARIPDALGAGYAGSTMLQKLYPRLVARDFAPAGYAFQALKDLDMVQGLAKELKVPLPMSAQATTLFRILNAKGHGELDGLAVLKLLLTGFGEVVAGGAGMARPATGMQLVLVVRCWRFGCELLDRQASAGWRSSQSRRRMLWTRLARPILVVARAKPMVRTNRPILAFCSAKTCSTWRRAPPTSVAFARAMRSGIGRRCGLLPVDVALPATALA